jgi:hypothetical protein
VIYNWCTGVKVIYHLNVSKNISTNSHWTLSEWSVKLFFNDIWLTFSSLFLTKFQNFNEYLLIFQQINNEVSLNISILTFIDWNFNYSLMRFQQIITFFFKYHFLFKFKNSFTEIYLTLRWYFLTLSTNIKLIKNKTWNSLKTCIF